MLPIMLFNVFDGWSRRAYSIAKSRDGHTVRESVPEGEYSMAIVTPEHDLSAMGIDTGAEVHWNLRTPQLVELAVARGEGRLAKDGPLVVTTGRHTGRSPQDKFMKTTGERVTFSPAQINRAVKDGELPACR